MEQMEVLSQAITPPDCNWGQIQQSDTQTGSFSLKLKL